MCGWRTTTSSVDAERQHALLGRMAAAGIADVFLVAGDAQEPLGSYKSALDLIGDLRANAKALRSVRVAADPEGHPLIDVDLLAESLREKAAHADYMTTQMC
jgi:methylenetetrahydrofolate reductase (NADPH)